MPRLVQWLFAASCAASALLLTSTLVLWTRSEWVAERYSVHGDRWETAVTSTAGSLSVQAVRYWSAASPRPASMARLTYTRADPWRGRPRDGSPTDPGVWSARSWLGVAWRMTDGGLGRAPPAPRPGPGWPPGALIYPARRDFFVRYWLLVVVFGVLPACYLARRQCIARRRRAGLCLTCGYNLTGNVSGICPECGMAVVSPAATIGSK